MEMKKREKNGWPLIRFVIPAFPEVNIFTRQARSMTALGPVMVATAANKIWGWQVEVVDENNYQGPRDNLGLPDHEKLQKERPATVVGFYCGLTSTMERVWEVSEFYHNKKVAIIAGGWHAHYCPEETLRHNIDIVVHGDGEFVIQQILQAIKEGRLIEDVPGISFWKEGQIRTNQPDVLEVDLNDLPYPDFGLLRYARMKIYPIGRVRGCRMNCEFCSVKGRPRWADSQYLFNVVNWLVETRKARSFFIVDDRLEEDSAGTLEFFKMISEKYGRQLNFTVQVRLEAASNSELLAVMKKAGVRMVCIGYESPIDKELKTMHKGYRASDMINWTKVYQSYGFRIHAMFIFGYPFKPEEGGSSISAKEMTRYFKAFIRQAHFSTIQILHPIPLVGTDLRHRLEEEGRIFPLELVPWSRYDGNYICFKPDAMSLREFQEIPMRLMKRFYDPMAFARIFLRTIFFPVDCVVRGWERWHRGWSSDIVKYGGHLLIGQWRKRQKIPAFLAKLEHWND